MSIDRNGAAGRNKPGGINMYKKRRAIARRNQHH
jgi:hypothetical protein